MLPTPENEQRERIKTIIHAGADAASALVAAELATLIRKNSAAGRPAVLGLATGSTPVRLYRELIRLHRDIGLSFRQVITFNLDEYHGLPRSHPESYWRFMHEQLFDHIDAPAANINIPDGTVPRAEVFAWCRAYEEKIRAAGDFLGEANVPRHAITMGIGAILAARQIVLIFATGGAADPSSVPAACFGILRRALAPTAGCGFTAAPTVIGRRPRSHWWRRSVRASSRRSFRQSTTTKANATRVQSWVSGCKRLCSRPRTTTALRHPRPRRIRGDRDLRARRP